MTVKNRVVSWGGARLSRRVGRALPYVGAAIAVVAAFSTMRRKGVISGAIDTGLNLTPLVGTAKNVAEMIRGRDFFPDKYGLDLPADDHPARPEDRRAGRFLRAQRGRGGVERGSGCVARLHPGVKRLQ